MNRIDSTYGQYRRTRVEGILSQGVPSLDKTAGGTGYHDLGGTIPSDFSLSNNTPQISTPYESIINEEIYLRDPETFTNPTYLTPGPYTATKSTASNSNTLTRTPVPAVGAHVEHGKHGTSTSSKRGRETGGKGGSQQGPAHKRARRNRAPSVRSSNVGAGDEDEEDEEDEDEEDEESDEDDAPIMSSGPKEPNVLLCPMPSCRGKGKQWDNWNNLIQHLQNTHIKGFSVCERGCGRRFGLSSQYTRHVFKRKKECKPLPLSGPPRRIPPLALDFNHAVAKVKGQNYARLKQVIEAHNYYDLEDPNHPEHRVEPSCYSTSSQNLHQYNPQGQLMPDWVEQIIRLLTGHQRVCQMHPQTDPPPSDPVRADGRLNGSSGLVENQHIPQNSTDPTIPLQLNQPAARRPHVYGTQPSAIAACIPDFQNGSSSSISGGYTPSFTRRLGQDTQGGGFARFGTGDYPQVVGSDYLSQCPTHTGSYIGNNTRANRGAPPSEPDHSPLPSDIFPFGIGVPYVDGTSDAPHFNMES
ncbi:unnamed protein product [Tuber melanosporum]|uniref:(Perigord truffle) hypothetical protein n=1 Tax=Tuber melanosporum (strain Mel28) TaxID=656061 RepID=D5GDA6_TUBMM|nr:uncharacterized protein GSTUM_00006124001 [Tuber melanosporum]CAZ82499.1 unnamed protein product [Tuber melanosporum]